MIPRHGTGQKDARAAKRKYYLMEEVRNERLTEGGDFVLSRRSEPLKLYDPHARNFVLSLTIVQGEVVILDVTLTFKYPIFVR